MTRDTNGIPAGSCFLLRDGCAHKVNDDIRIYDCRGGSGPLSERAEAARSEGERSGGL